ncbi:MAG: DUF4148 domain-containing protein [Comamonadaceae bacterium]|nr:MAG: DUF4148 domain-containing protein [Comamonadaceae bacterium]
MNAKILFATVAIAAAASGVARADDAPLSSQFAIKFEGSRTRAEVMAEAAKVSATRSQEPAGSRVAAPLKSGLDVHAVRAEAVEALRLGKIPSGERSL